MLYFGSSNTTLPNGTIAAGTIRAVYPGNGTTKWLAPTPLSVWGGLTYADGLVAAGLTGGDTDASQGGLLVLNASDGRTLFYRSNAAVWGEPIIVNGEVLYGSGDLSSTGGGSVTALALPFAGSLSTTVTERQPEASYGLRLLLEGGVLPYDASWTFGDGTVAYGLGASHSFDRPGVFHASVRVRDAAGASLTINFTLNGTAPAVAPAAAGVPLLELGIVAGAAILAAAVLVVYVVTRRRRRSAGVGSPPPPTGRPPEAG
jgi:hypothetical protein